VRKTRFICASTRFHSGFAIISLQEFDHGFRGK
jgi:hypothetical protein